MYGLVWRQIYNTVVDGPFHPVGVVKNETKQISSPLRGHYKLINPIPTHPARVV